MFGDKSINGIELELRIATKLAYHIDVFNQVVLLIDGVIVKGTVVSEKQRKEVRSQSIEDAKQLLSEVFPVEYQTNVVEKKPQLAYIAREAFADMMGVPIESLPENLKDLSNSSKPRNDSFVLRDAEVFYQNETLQFDWLEVQYSSVSALSHGRY